MSTSVQLLVSGLISADITFRVAEMPRRAEKYRAEDVRFSLGGGGAIAAVAMQQLGAGVQLAGRLGDDLFGDLLRSELSRRAVGKTLLACIVGSKSPISSVFVDDHGERQIVTDGERGVTWLDNGELGHVPAFPIKALDTLGAGDVWHAAFTLKLAQGSPEQPAIVFANAAAALKCLSSDGLDGIPDESAVVAFLKLNGVEFHDR